jgi:protein-S-isoprenylcysteine O-methyltransferase Ste14
VAETRDIAGVIAPPPLIYAAPLALGLAFQRIRPLPLLPDRVARPLGTALIGVGVVGAGWFIRTMRQANTPVDPREPVAHLVTDGPFRFSRNPGYVSMALLYLGVTARANALWPALLLPGAIGMIRRGVIEREERYLERLFGDDYARYRARVRRWV